MSDLDMLAAALDYAQRGWPVFPVNSRTNGPLLRSAHPEGDPLHGVCKGACGRDGHGFHDATTDLDTVVRWWRNDPHAAIGVRTGVVFDVLDIDCEDFAEGVRDLPDVEVVCPWARSGGGGWHAYFRPSGLGRRIKFSKYCDWLGTDGYVIVPPSKHKSGGQYQWITSFDDVLLSDVPDVLLEAVGGGVQSDDEKPAPRLTLTAEAGRESRKDPEKRQASSGGGKRLDTYKGGSGGWSPAGLVGQMAMASEGSRHNTLCWVAWRAGFDVHEKKVPEAVALEALEQIARAASFVGLPDKEIDRTVTDCYKAGKNGERGRVGGRK